MSNKTRLSSPLQCVHSGESLPTLSSINLLVASLVAMSLPPNLRSGFARSKRKNKLGKSRAHESSPALVHTQYASTSTGDIKSSQTELRYGTQGESSQLRSSVKESMPTLEESLPIGALDDPQDAVVELVGESSDWFDEEEEDMAAAQKQRKRGQVSTH